MPLQQSNSLTKGFIVIAVMWPNFGFWMYLRHCCRVRHCIIGDPGRQIIIERGRVDNSLAVHKAHKSELRFVDMIVDISGLHHQFVGQDTIVRGIVVPTRDGVLI